jgi:transcriptional regulator with XRE-family HTH domain
MNIGQRIRDAREELGMPQTVLARRVGVVRQTVARYESGEHEPSFAMLEKIARELRTEPAELLKEPVDVGKVSARSQAGLDHIRRPHESISVDDAFEVEVWLDNVRQIFRALDAGEITPADAYQRIQKEARGA